jgi:Polysaccharide deacetylase
VWIMNYITTHTAPRPLHPYLLERHPCAHDRHLFSLMIPMFVCKLTKAAGYSQTEECQSHILRDGRQSCDSSRHISAVRFYRPSSCIQTACTNTNVNTHTNDNVSAAAEGHEVANHVWDHPVLSKLTFDKVHDQITRTNSAIRNATSSNPSVMRPPYGNTNPKLNEYLTKGENLPVVMWSLGTTQ